MTQLSKTPEQIKKFRILIIIASIAIPAVVALLFRVNLKGIDLSFLPSFYAIINGLTALLLVFALVAIKMKKMNIHRMFINTSMVLSLLFLVMYVLYHMTSKETLYGDLDGSGKLETAEALLISGSQVYYYILLASHILLSMAVVPLVLFTYLFAWSGNFQKHKKWTRFTWPIWFYVAVSGVIVYWMISPYY